MIWVITALSILFIILAYVLTESNARYLLAGYNTMGESDRKKVDLKGFIPFFKRFHLFLGISFFTIGNVLLFLTGEREAGVFLGAYPILAYLYFIRRSKGYYKGVSRAPNKIGAIVLVITLLMVSVIMYLGLKEDRLLVDEQQIEIQGFYGEKLGRDEIQDIEFVNDLPEITFKTNGFALGGIRKGKFRTREGEVVKLILNERKPPYLLITTKSSRKIYYSSLQKEEVEKLEEGWQAGRKH